ncbi:DUF6364 family protein [Polaribacter porphyrae]|uniref:Antitoxin n=1 Tax=Polaribacter porphyrae TaxID=1137780 RepID=A0A2S7WLG9_9FLAO|nr:DUF6364 family protein [Polaribacter porphyrae]PQJ78276.1 hypothetical protein BTO18_03310 [Polaribacter porphyrae]
MDSKLTLKLNKAVIEQAKAYAKEQQISLSRLIENYLATITKSKIESDKREIEITPLVKSLSGIAKVEGDFDEKQMYRDYLLEKYK